MKIAYYCQHVLGVGHFHRSLQICRSLAQRHKVTMITGGRELDITCATVRFLQLPGLMMDRGFNHLIPCDSGYSLDHVKYERTRMVMDFFRDTMPEVFIVELYPFGRKAFRFELDPVLEAIHSGDLSPSLVCCSLRDILVEKNDQEKVEKRILATLNTFFDGLLIHADHQFSSLEETFRRVADITVPIAYTGYVTSGPDPGARQKIRESLRLSAGTRLLVASIGGGNVGTELLISIAETVARLGDETLFLQIFTGPYADSTLVETLTRYSSSRIGVARFTSEFTNWLAAADLSVSMAGYNTCMNILAAGTPALLYPFDQNREQYMRVKTLSRYVPFTILDKQDLTAEKLAGRVYKQLSHKRFTSPVNLDGAANTALQIEKWQNILKV